MKQRDSQKNKEILKKTKRFSKIKTERVDKMMRQQHDADAKAALLEENLDLVDSCILMLRTGMDAGEI
jgi:hypothetical protein